MVNKIVNIDPINRGRTAHVAIPAQHIDLIAAKVDGQSKRESCSHIENGYMHGMKQRWKTGSVGSVVWGELSVG